MLFVFIDCIVVEIVFVENDLKFKANGYRFKFSGFFAAYRMFRFEVVLFLDDVWLFIFGEGEGLFVKIDGESFGCEVIEYKMLLSFCYTDGFIVKVFEERGIG